MNQSCSNRRRRRRRSIRLSRLIVAAPLLAGLLSLSCGGETRYEPVDVNVLLITMDTTRPDHLGCYGHPGGLTPTIDRIASEGTRFSRATACTPLTLPSHSTIMTGRYPFAHGVQQNMFDRLGESQTTLAESLQEAGFVTYAAIGSVILRRKFGLDQGFDWYNEPQMGKSTNVSGPERKANEVSYAVITQMDAIAGERFFLWVHYYDPHFPYESARVPRSIMRDSPPVRRCK